LNDLLVASVILIIFAGFTEEMIFRLMIQQTLNRIFGRFGVFLAGVLFASMYVGSLSPGYVLFIGLSGLFFGFCVECTGSIWGAAAAHGLMNVAMLIGWPLLWQ